MFERTYQLKLPFNIKYLIPKDESVRLLGQIVEEMNLQELYQFYSRLGNNQATPKQMLKLLLYAYMNRTYSSRDIERSCNRDINFMYHWEGMPAPDHATIARFCSLRFAPLSKELFSQLNGILSDCGELSLENMCFKRPQMHYKQSVPPVKRVACTTAISRYY